MNKIKKKIVEKRILRVWNYQRNVRRKRKKLNEEYRKISQRNRGSDNNHDLSRFFFFKSRELFRRDNNLSSHHVWMLEAQFFY